MIDIVSNVLESIGLNLGELVWIGIISATIFLVATWRHFISLFDPLVLYVAGMVSNCVLMYGLNWDPGDKLKFTAYISFFWLGFLISGRSKSSKDPITPSANDLFGLYLICVLFLIVIVGAGLSLGLTTGFPLLSSDPSRAKVEYVTGGLGFVRRVEGAPFTFFCGACALLIVWGYRRFQIILMLVVGLCFEALSGSKGAVLITVYVFSFVFAHQGISRNRKAVKSAKSITILIGGLAGLVALTVSARDNGGVFQGIAYLIIRVLYSGDVILYYYPNKEIFSDYGAHGMTSYLYYLFQSTLGMFRLIPYEQAIGTLMLGGGNDGFGPNVQFFVRADIFFGPIMGCIYSISLGILISNIRKLFLKSNKSSLEILVWKLTLSVLAFNIAMESQYFITDFVDLIVVFIPAYLLKAIAIRAISKYRQDQKALA